MSILLSTQLGVNGLAQMFGLLAVFILILVMAYVATKWFAKFQTTATKNIQVLEVYRINPNKLIEIVKVGNKYIVIGVSKDSMVFLTELKEEDIIISTETMVMPDFKDILSKLNKSDKKSKG